LCAAGIIEKMGINARPMDHLDRSTIQLRQLDGGESGVFWPAANLAPHEPE
jgi:hypothetical protein